MALGDYDQSAVLLAVEGAVRTGRDAQQLALDLIDRLRVGFLSLVSGRDLDSSLDVQADELELLRGLGTARLVRAMELIGAAVVAMRDSPDPRITLEVAFLRLSRPEDELSLDALTERIDRLERQLEQSPIPGPTTRQSQPPPPAAARPQEPPPEGGEALARATPELDDQGQTIGEPARDLVRRTTRLPSDRRSARPEPAPRRRLRARARGRRPSPPIERCRSEGRGAPSESSEASRRSRLARPRSR